MSGAYQLGAMDGSGKSSVTGGVGGVAVAAANAALSPLRRTLVSAADGIKDGFEQGSRNAVSATGGAFVSKAGTGTGGASEPSSHTSSIATDEGPPAWAQRMRRGRHIGHGVDAAVHAVRSGDSHGPGTSVNLSERDNS